MDVPTVMVYVTDYGQFVVPPEVEESIDRWRDVMIPTIDPEAPERVLCTEPDVRPHNAKFWDYIEAKEAELKAEMEGK